MSISNLHTMPHEVLREISYYLPAKDLCRMSQTNRQLNHWNKSSSVWRERVKEEFPEKYQSCYRFLSSESVFPSLYAVELLKTSYKNRCSVIAELDESCVANLAIQGALLPIIAGPIRAAYIGLALGAVKVVKAAVEHGLPTSEDMASLRQYFNTLYNI